MSRCLDPLKTFKKEVFAGPNTYAQGIWKTRDCLFELMKTHFFHQALSQNGIHKNDRPKTLKTLTALTCFKKKRIMTCTASFLHSLRWRLSPQQFYHNVSSKSGRGLSWFCFCAAAGCRSALWKLRRNESMASTGRPPQQLFWHTVTSSAWLPHHSCPR